MLHWFGERKKLTNTKNLRANATGAVWPFERTEQNQKKTHKYNPGSIKTAVSNKGKNLI